MAYRATVVVATCNHAAYLPDAIESVLAQTRHTECIVVDDGSTDETPDVLRRYAGRIKAIRQAHAGVAAARNVGMRHGTTGHVGFLDADDVLYCDAIEQRLAALTEYPYADWAFGDIKIVDVSGKVELASARYDYAGKGLPGRSDLKPLLDVANFIPVHAPLIRRSAMPGVEFPEGKVEDWAFWRALAAVAPARYVPEVVGEYRKRRGGRNAQQ